MITCRHLKPDHDAPSTRIIAVMLSLCGSGAIGPASVALGADPAARTTRRRSAPRSSSSSRSRCARSSSSIATQCHSSEAKVLKGGLRLDSRGGWMKGGDSGPAVVPGSPDESLLIEAIRYRIARDASPGEAAGIGDRRAGAMGQDGGARSANRSRTRPGPRGPISTRAARTGRSDRSPSRPCRE